MNKPRRLNDHPLWRISAFLTTVGVVLYTGAALLFVAMSLAVYSLLQAIGGYQRKCVVLGENGRVIPKPKGKR